MSGYNAGTARARYPLGGERIYLRALLVTYADGRNEPAIALPDDRIIVGGNQTYSSEKALLHLNPGARIEWAPNADAVINHVMELPDE